MESFWVRIVLSSKDIHKNPQDSLLGSGDTAVENSGTDLKEEVTMATESVLKGYSVETDDKDNVIKKTDMAIKQVQ